MNPVMNEDGSKYNPTDGTGSRASGSLMKQSRQRRKERNLIEGRYL